MLLIPGFTMDLRVEMAHKHVRVDKQYKMYKWSCMHLVCTFYLLKYLNSLRCFTFALIFQKYIIGVWGCLAFIVDHFFYSGLLSEGRGNWLLYQLCSGRVFQAPSWEIKAQSLSICTSMQCPSYTVSVFLYLPDLVAVADARSKTTRGLQGQNNKLR